MRITKGKYSKREISVVGRTRPPLLRIRKSVFDIIDPQDKVVLDLCAGSGSFGLEALSLGAKFVYFVEENHDTAMNLLSTLKKWNVDNAKVIIKNVNYLPIAQVTVDVVLFDPPFGHNYIKSILERLVKKGWVKHGAHAMIRYNEALDLNSDVWKMYRVDRVGKSHMHYCAYRAGSEDDLIV